MAHPGHLPFSWKILLSVYVPEYLYKSRSLATRLPFDQLQRQAHINPVALAVDHSPDFSQRIRANIEKPQLQCLVPTTKNTNDIKMPRCNPTVINIVNNDPLL